MCAAPKVEDVRGSVLAERMTDDDAFLFVRHSTAFKKKMTKVMSAKILRIIEPHVCTLPASEQSLPP